MKDLTVLITSSSGYFLGGGFDLYKLLNGTTGKSNKYFNLTLIQLAVLFLTRILVFSLYIRVLIAKNLLLASI